MADTLRDPIQLTDTQVEALRRLTAGGTQNFPEGYRLIHGWIAGSQAARDDGTVFWFEQAAGINGNDSLSARFIRRHTQNGLDVAGVPLDQRLPMQELSNRIARQVITDILDTGQVDPLAGIISKDISVALDQGRVALAGWGGSFYYWDQPYRRPGEENFRTMPDGSLYSIGDEIVATGQRNVLVETSARTLRDMTLAGEIGIGDIDDVLNTSLTAGAPADVKADITLRTMGMLLEHSRDRFADEIRDQIDRLTPSMPNIRDLIPSVPNLRDLFPSEIPWPQFPLRASSQSETPNSILSSYADSSVAAADSRGLFKDSHADRYYAALVARDSDAMDRIAVQFAKSPEGQQMAQSGDQLLAEHRLQEQRQAQDQQLPQTDTRQGPTMRV